VKNRASSDLADELHALTFKLLIEELRRYRKPGKDADGKPLPAQPIPPALFAQCLKALKDNGIDQPTRAQALRDELADVLPELGEVEDEHLNNQ